MTNQEIPGHEPKQPDEVLDTDDEPVVPDQDGAEVSPSGRLETQRAIIASEVFWRVGIGDPDYYDRNYPW